MKKKHLIAPALLIAATAASPWGNAIAEEATVKPEMQQALCPHDPNAPDPNWGWSVGKAPQPIKDFSYSGQPEFQVRVSRLGSSPNEIHENFASIIESNFQYGSTEHILNNLSERELQDLAKFYTANTQGKSQPLLKVFAQNLSDQSLIRVAKAFGTEPVKAAVNSYATANTRSAFDTKIAALDSVAPTVSPTSELVTPMATPTLDMTIQEIYLEFRTAPVGSVGPTAAIAETSMYVGKNVAVAASVGWAIGTEINNLIETYDPSLNEAIGGTVAGMVDAANQSLDLTKQGQYQSSFDALFGYPVSTSGNRAGDFGEFQAMDYYWSSNGCY
ncbi:hypothetical protein [Dyella sp.]|uniref:hypothetical protein n=1 Tax=Dyella sp. TaxID=1869338 RepID=UPI002FD9A6AE